MSELKYIMLDDLTPIIFAEHLEHSRVAEVFPNVISAGFCNISGSDREDDEIIRGNPLDVSAWGRSTTLKLDSRPEDARLIRRFLERPLK
jgi:hypothetical protein